VTEQKNRGIVHLLHYIPQPRVHGVDGGEHTIPLANVRLALRAEQKWRQVYLAPGKQILLPVYSSGSPPSPSGL
jgi:hypothetical protein